MDAHLRKRRINARKISQHILSQEEPHSRMPISPSGSFRMGINMSYPYLPYSIWQSSILFYTFYHLL